MKNRLRAFALCIVLALTFPGYTLAARLGPAATYEELLSLAASASQGDTLLVAGDITASPAAPLAADVPLLIRGADGGATITGLSLESASVEFSDLILLNGLRVRGNSHVQIMRGVSVLGGVDFAGSGALLIDPGAAVEGMPGSPGVSVSHRGGDLYISIDGTVRGGAGDAGGSAVEIDPLGASGALMITGTLLGGAGDAFGGNALNLHNLTGNAYITVDGRLTGGAGNIGGVGLQLITADGSVTAGIGGRITGGRGNSYGGDALMLMNVGGSASVALSGMLTGGDSSGTDSVPGQSLKLLGRTTAMRTSVGDCILEDGRQVLFSIAVTPLPAITSSVDDPSVLVTPEPTPAAPEQTPAPQPTPEPPVATDGEASAQ